MCQDFNGPFSESAGKDAINSTSVDATSQQMQHELFEFALAMDMIVLFGIWGSDHIDSAVPGNRRLHEKNRWAHRMGCRFSIICQ